MSSILVVEDDAAIRELVTLSLETVGFAVRAVGTAREALAELERDKVDLIVLDAMLPDGSGYSLLPRIRSADMPVIMLTVRDSLADKVRGLEAGADDYMTKPFETLELVARVRCVLRRRSRESTRYSAAGIELDADARIARKDGRPVELTRQEFELLRCLLEHRGMALGRERLLELAWGRDSSAGTRTVDVHVRRLREKLATDAIHTVVGTGYRLEG